MPKKPDFSADAVSSFRKKLQQQEQLKQAVPALTQKEPLAVQPASPEIESRVESEEVKKPEVKKTARSKKETVAGQGSISSQLVLPEKKEIKSVTKTFKIKPSIAEGAARKAAELGTSVNDVVNQLLQIWIEEE